MQHSKSGGSSYYGAGSSVNPHNNNNRGSVSGSNNNPNNNQNNNSEDPYDSRDCCTRCTLRWYVWLIFWIIALAVIVIPILGMVISIDDILAHSLALALFLCFQTTTTTKTQTHSRTQSLHHLCSFSLLLLLFFFSSVLCPIRSFPSHFRRLRFASNHSNFAGSQYNQRIKCRYILRLLCNCLLINDRTNPSCKKFCEWSGHVLLCHFTN